MAAAEALAFDSSGDAWVADWDASHIVEFSAAQLGSSAAPTPADTINTGNHPEALGFDAHGNLWVTITGGKVLEYTPAQLAAGGAPNPTVTITLPGGADPFGMAFDHRGSLWISDRGNQVMLGFTAAQIAATGSPTPAVTDTLDLASSFSPEQPVFDAYATTMGVAPSHVRPHAVSAGHIRQASQNPARVVVNR